MSNATALLKDADLCVKCGLCLPHCPTYGLHQHEADSPRGRINLIQGLASAALPVSAKLEQHLGGCLSCRACEAVCPAKVPFSRLMDGARTQIAAERPARSAALSMAMNLMTWSPLRRAMFALLWLYQKLGFSWLVQTLLRGTALGRAAGLMPTLSWPQRLKLASAASRQQVQLFIGCTGEHLDAAALQDSITVLERLGFAVDIPANQGCCGALHQHAGFTAKAARLAEANQQAFTGHAPILSFASGCAATLKDYPDLIKGGAEVAVRVQDISEFVAAHWPLDLQLKPLKARVAVHTACTLRNVLRAEAALPALLKKIPQLEWMTLDPAGRCCGAAGSHMLTAPQAADALLQPKLDGATRLQPDYILSSNIGCSLHLGAGLRRAGQTIPVLHPMSLLARCL